MRKLVSIQKIEKIETHTNADSLEIAQVLGWQCIIKKGEYKEGETIVFFEIDSFIPITSEFEFLRKNCYKKYEDGREGFRIRTIRLRSFISQGLIMPLSILPENMLCEIDVDVTELLGVSQWNPPIPASLKGKVKGNFPSFLPKTDETRIQNVLLLIKRFKGIKCFITEKIDGTSITCYLKDGEFGVCGRNLEFYEDDSDYWKVVKEFGIKDKLIELSKILLVKNIAIQGEIFGLGLQGNPLIQNEKRVAFFKAYFLYVVMFN